MSVTRRTWMACIATLWLAPDAWAGEAVYWARSSGPVQVNAFEVPCGPVGVFYFAQSNILTSQQGGVLSGKASTMIMNGGSNSVLIVEGQTPLYEEPQPLEAPGWVLEPTQDGDWFGVQEGPWIAMIDFEGAGPSPSNALISHGHAVAWTIHLLSDRQANVALYPLDRDQADEGLPAASDAQFLARLCELAEYIDNPDHVKPLALNMSFGRYASEGEAEPCGPDETSPLSCQIRAVLDYLQAEGVLLVAAAGNHGEDTFPAVYQGVLAVGRLDLHRYQGGNWPSVWQNPSSVSALFPGDGLSLERGWEPNPPPPLWLPSGSSFAAAAFTGHVPNLNDRGGDPTSGFWYPALNGESNAFGPQNVEDPLANQPISPPLTDLFDRLRLTARLLGPGVIEAVAEMSPCSDPIQDVPSLPEQLNEANVPWPETKPCLPCTGNVVGPAGKSGRLATPGLSTSGVATLTRLTVDLGDSEPAPGWIVKEVYLRMGGLGFYSFDFNTPQNPHPSPLAAISNGLLDRIQLAFTSRNVPEFDQQISLIFILERDDDPSIRAWTSANVFIPEYLLDWQP